MRKTLVNEATGLVVNVIQLPDDWSGMQDQWQVPKGHIVVDDEGSPGDTWNGTVILKPLPSPPVDQKTTPDRLDDVVRLLIGNGTITRVALDTEKDNRQ